MALLTAVLSGRHQLVWLADVDDTLTDTVRMHEEASNSVAEVLVNFVDRAKAFEITDRFADIFRLLLTSHQSTSVGDTTDEDGTQAERVDVEERIDNYQSEIKEEWGATKKFSREVLLRVAGEDCGVLLTPDQIRQCADHYWTHVENNAICFNDAIRLTERLREDKTPLFLFTSSDARMTLKDNGNFEYDPVRSRNSKARRVERLRAKGLYFLEAIIGDPIDKPTPEFFNLVYQNIQNDLRVQIRPTDFVVIGDSYDSDLEFPLSEWNVALGILYRRGQSEVAMEHKSAVSVGNWDIVSELLADR